MTSWNRIGVWVLAVLASSSALAQVGSAPSVTERRTQIVAAAQKGSPFLTDTRQSYQVVVGLRATVRGDATAEARMAALGLPATDLVEEKGPYLVFRRMASGATASSRLAEASAVAAVDGTPAYPVVLNTRTGELAILPGIVIAKLRDTAEATALAEANGLSVKWVGQMTRYGYFRVPQGGDVVSAAAALAQDPRVEIAYPEVSEKFMHAN